MNKHVHRLVFDRRRGMRVPAAEHVRSAGKAGGGDSRAQRPVAAACAALVLGAGLAAWSPGEAWAQQRSIGGTMQRSADVAALRAINPLPTRTSTLNTPDLSVGDFGDFTIDASGNLLTINQADQKIIINWKTFDIAKGYTVRFDQPTGGAALNNVWGNDVSVIQGNLQANGEVILQNQNGIIFSPTARVETGRFVATALGLAKQTFLDGIRANLKGEPTFVSDDEHNKGFITVERGAEIKALAGGDVLMVAPKVFNEGRIETPKGQTVMAAGQKVYLYSSSDPSQRGLVVAVDPFVVDANSPAGINTVEQAAAGTYQTLNGETVTGDTPAGTTGLETKINQVVAEQGTINLVGLTVRQNGVLTATTAVKGLNGAIYLQGQKSTSLKNDATGPRTASELGTVELGANSITSVTPSTSSDTQTSTETFNRSRINIDGKDVRIGAGALVQAVSGNIQIRAADNAKTSSLFDPSGVASADGSTLLVESGATISAAGLRDVTLPMSRNQLNATLFQIELADSPVQRNGVIYRQEVFADARQQVRVANVTGYYNLIGRTARELSTTGGTVLLASTGKTIVADGAKIDISGGSVRYTPGQLFSSLLSNQNGIVSLEDADPTTRYTGLITPDQANSKLPTTASYEEGANAGYLGVLGSTLYLGADINASVVVGPLQRGGASFSETFASTSNTDNLMQEALIWPQELASSPWLYASLRPRAGTMDIIGQVRGKEVSVLGQVNLVAQKSQSVSSIPDVGTEEASAFFQGLAGTTQLSASMLQASGLGHLKVKANAFEMAPDASLNLGASGSLNVIAHSELALNGQVLAEGGSVALTVEDNAATLTLGDAALIDVSGRVADDRGQVGAGGVSVNGGSVSLSAAGSVDLGRATIDASGGYWLTGSNKYKGTAGAISVAVNVGAGNSSPRSGRIWLDDATLSAYDFSSGGKLSLTGVRTLSIGAVPEADQAKWADGLQLSADFFSQGGFGSYTLSAIGDVEVVAGTQVNARMQNLFVPSTKRSLAGAGTAGLITTTLADGLRSGVSLSLTASSTPDRSDGAQQNEFRDGSSITIGQKALVNTGLGGSISLNAGHSITVEGELRAKGGNVRLALSGNRSGGEKADNSENDIGYVEDQEIRLTKDGTIDVSGAAKTVQAAGGLRTTGSVLAGGTVNLNYAEGNPSRGRVVTEKGSTINVSGASEALNLDASAAKTLVSKGAGTVIVASADGFSLQGTLKAERPDASVAGGQFIASLSLERGNDVVNSGGTAIPYEVAKRDVLLLGTADDVISHAEANGLVFGQGVVSTGQLLNAGFDRITIRSDDQITLGSGANLVSAPAADNKQVPLREVNLTTRQLVAGDDQTHTVQAAYVSLGNKDLVQKGSNALELEATAASGTANASTLAVNAGLIEVYGYTGLSGFGQTHLHATLAAGQDGFSRTNGEIRFIGRTLNASSKDVAGQLSFAGDLTLKAGSVYTTTLSDYKVLGQADTSTLTLLAPDAGSTSAQPLSALGHLHLEAHDIKADGVVYQPFGQITIKADNKLEVGSHAVLSVSGEGLTVPVGTTVNGDNWSYATAGTLSGVNLKGVNVKLLDDLSLAKGVSLTGTASLSLDSEAKVAAQAGGDLQAWEFVPGVGGSTDVLNAPGYYAIVPNYAYDFAPYDTEVAATAKAAGASLGVGSQVTIKTSNNVLAAGTYTLLPARYALLPGAVLVSSTNVAKGGTLSQAVALDDGSVVVSGYQTATGTALGSSAAGAALVLAPQATVLARSKLALSSINSYKAQQAASAGTAADMPGEAGRIALESNAAFDVLSRLVLNGGGELDVVMGSKMAIVDGTASAPTGYAKVDAQALAASGAGSILVGGKREGSLGDVTVTAKSKEVLWATSIETPTELISVATDTVAVADGVTLKNTQVTNEDEQTITLKGQSAALVLSDHVKTSIKRDLSGVADDAVLAGSLNVGKNVTLGGEAVQMDATKSITLGEGLGLSARALSLGARTMLLGGTTDDKSVLSLSATQMQSLSNLQYLSLRSTGRIDVAAGLSVGQRAADGSPTLKSLVLDAPELRGVGSNGGSTVFTAREVVLQNSGAGKASGLSGQGDLQIVAEPALNDVQTGGITISGGQQNLAFNQVTLHSKGDVVFDGQGQLNTQGDATIQAARVTATKGASQQLKAGGTLTVAAVAAGSHTLNESRGAGASLALQGTRVVQAGLIDLPSGKLTVQGTGQFDDKGQLSEAKTVVFEQGSVTTTAGRVTQAGTSWAVSSAGGDITAVADAGQLVVRGALNVSAAALASESDAAKTAGTVTLKATGSGGEVVLSKTASLLGQASTDTLSGKLVVDTGAITSEGVIEGETLGTLDRVARLANAGQMRGGINLRLRDEVNQTLDTTMKAVRTQIAVDKGSLTLMGHALVDASAPQGGVVSLSARDDLVLSSNSDAQTEGDGAPAGARILAQSSREGANGGDVLLASTDGVVEQQAGATVSAGGDAGDTLDGRIVLRAGINTEVLNDENPDYGKLVKVKLADASGLSAGEVTVEPVKVYTNSGENNVFVYVREVQKAGTVTKKEVVASGTRTKTTTSVGQGVITVLERYTKDADGNIVVVGETITGGTFNEGITPKVTTANTAATVAVGSTYTVASGAKVVSTTEAGLALNQSSTENIAASTIVTDAALVMDHAADVAAALGLDKVSLGKGGVRYGVELRSSEDLSVLQNWNLADMRLGGAPINLTIRSEGQLTIRGNLSDGFASASTAADSATVPTLINEGDAASFRLVAGADLGSADVMATKDASTAGDLVIGKGALVRTTAGSIELAASRDVKLESGDGTTPVQGVVYVAGRASTLASDEQDASAVNQWAQFTEHGGRLDVRAGRDITAPGFTQLIGNWLYHAGPSAGSEAWWSSLDSFKQGFGSFGGGNIMVSAAGDITNVGVVAPTSGRYINTIKTTTTLDDEGNEVVNTEIVGTRWQLNNGGDVTVKAGGDIQGGVYLLSRGQGLIDAGGELTTGTAYDATKISAQNAILGLMDGQWMVQARGDLAMGLVYNPTILPTASTRVGSNLQGMYYTYAQDSALYLSSAGGGVLWSPGGAAYGVTVVNSNWHNLYAPTNEKVLTTTFTKIRLMTEVAPPIVRVAAGGGDVSFMVADPTKDEAILFPSAIGDLSVYAAGNLQMGLVSLAQTDPTLWPSLGNPVGSFGSGNNGAVFLPTEIASAVKTLLATGSTLHQNDEVPVRLFAEGDMNFGAEVVAIPKTADIQAGGDINGLALSVQHFDDQSVSLVKAGGDLIGQAGASKLDDIKNLKSIKVAGAGELQVEAGRDVNLNVSDGIVAVGNEGNDQLPDVSANIRVLAGAAREVVLDTFRAQYLDGNADAQAQLIDHVRTVLNLGDEALTDEQAYAEALALFAGFSRVNQEALADKVIGQAFVKAFVAQGQAYADAWATAAKTAGVAQDAYDSTAFKRFKDDVLLAEVARLGKAAVSIADSTDAAVNEQNRLKRQALWDELNQALSLAGMGDGFSSKGNIEVAASKIKSYASGDLSTGGVDLFAPGGDIVVGLVASNRTGGGIVTEGGGSIHAVLDGDFQVNSQKAFVVGRGDLTIYTRTGSIDSGRGSNTTVSAPKAKGKLIDGYMTFVPGAVTSGSGLALLTLPDGTAEGDVNLFAPVGGILALDTFIRNQSGSGSVNLGGPVKGADNVKGGNVNGAPVTVASGPSISAPTSLPSDTAAGTQEVNKDERDAAKKRSGILTVDLISIGDGADAPAAGNGDQNGEKECEEGKGKGCVKRP